jgi:anti-sigma factor RsiW
MTCTVARHHALTYIDGEAGPDLGRRIDDHLAICPACAGWFDRQGRLERAIRDRLAAGDATLAVWGRILDRSVIRPRTARPARRLALAGLLTAAAVLLVALLGPWQGGSARHPELAHDAAELHGRWLRGEVRPDFESRSDLEVDRYLKASVPFRVHCPPRTDVAFAVQGAGVCSLEGRHRAAYIVGRVDREPVSILVLDRSSLAAFPEEQPHQKQRRHRREGRFRMVSGLAADNVVVVTGTAPDETLERLLDAYGTYPDEG